uniref:Uncharacterized protein n=1 Tax=Acrobeloides nanus TaxID=290746 RepID=A0A914ECL6_9BILA
ENSSIESISTIFIGNDKKFTLKIIAKLEVNSYILENTSRGEDLCFGIHYCNSLIITAGASTFGWWIGYLKNQEGPVFYNTKMVLSKKNIDKEKYSFDGFPSHWIGLAKNETEYI